MGARIDDSDLLARLADHIVATKGATLADALKALGVPHPSHRRIYTKWDRRGLGLVTEAAWRATAALRKIFDTTYAKGYDAGLFDGKAMVARNTWTVPASMVSPASMTPGGVCDEPRCGPGSGGLAVSQHAKKLSLLSRVKARFWE